MNRRPRACRVCGKALEKFADLASELCGFHRTGKSEKQAENLRISRKIPVSERGSK